MQFNSNIMLKEVARELLQMLRFDVTKNLEYDRLTKRIIIKALDANSNAIDVGCHKGEILELILRIAPVGKHTAFEPLPSFYENLVEKYGKRARILNYALSDKEGKTKFQFVKNAPAYSGIKKRKYEVQNPEIEEIEVEMKKLDDLIEPDMKIDLIKIDVEGAEMGVLKGASELVKRDKPLIIFECGIGASDYYGTEPQEVFLYFDRIQMKVSTLKGFVKKGEPLSEEEFVRSFKSNSEYYFVAHP